MNHVLHKHITYFVLPFILTCFFMGIPAAASSAGEYDYSHRKRDCEVKIVTPDKEPLPYIFIGIGQLRNHFAFGGTIRWEAFDTLIDGYEEKFLSFFDVAAPENEMMWENVMNCSQKCAPDFSKADLLVDWLLGKKILIRGRTLFSNEKEERIPVWTRGLETVAFKQAMKERIDTAMSHFKGKIFQWNLIDAVCHGENGSFMASSMLETKSGDPNIFSWIMDEARKIDTIATFTISDNGIFTSSDSTAANRFISKVKPLVSKFDIVCVTAHFGANMNKSSYEAKINYLAQQLGKPVWITDVDFSFDINQAPDKIEELMRTCFANPNVGGLFMGGWHQRTMSGSNLTSYFVDSLNNETPAGERWRDVRREWRTETQGNADDSGKFSFNGFHGNYQVLISCDIYNFYLEPGEGVQRVEIVYSHEDTETTFIRASAGQKKTEIKINGISVPIKLPFEYNGQLFLTIYSLSGQQLSRSPIKPTGGKHRVTPASSSCKVFRIETADRVPLYTGKITAVH